MVLGLFRFVAARKLKRRRRRTAAIAGEISKIIGNDGIVVMNDDQFFDINHVKEVIDMLSMSGVSIRANVFQSRVIFYAEGAWTRY